MTGKVRTGGDLSLLKEVRRELPARRYRIGLIGCGLRGLGYLLYLLKQDRGCELVAVADPDESSRKFACRKFSEFRAAEFRSGRELLEQCKVDAVIIASPNSFHRDDAVLAMERGVTTLLEKPVATSIDDLQAMWHSHLATGSNVVVGFVLRYTAFYRKVHEIIKSGVLGKVLTVNAEELMSDRLSMMFARGSWRPDSQSAGGLLLEKCCHDMDVLNWLVDSRVNYISSMAARTFLLPKPEAGSHCSVCSLEPECRFAKVSINQSFKHDWHPELEDMFGKLDDDRCAFDARNQYPDHQTVSLEYENGVLCNFTVAQAQPATRRTIHILGTEARLYGVFEEDSLRVFSRVGANDEVIATHRVSHDGSGHGGGDTEITNDFFAVLQRQERLARPGLAEGIEAAMLCMAADQSAKERRMIDVAEFRAKAFGKA